MKLDFSSVWQYWPFLYHGALTTLKITAMAAVLGFILGVLLSLIKISKCKPLVWFGNFYTSIFRGTPVGAFCVPARTGKTGDFHFGRADADG